MICLIVFLASSGAWVDALQDAESPAGGQQVADLLFILSADLATFATADTLVLSYCSSTAQFYGKGAHAGVIPTERFMNDTLGSKYVSSNGQWLGNPIATLYGFDLNMTKHGILITLSAPTVNAESRTVIFKATTMTSGEPSIKTRNGVANNVVEDFGNVKDFLLTKVQAGTMLYDVGLFIDSDTNALGLEAHTKETFVQRAHAHGRKLKQNLGAALAAIACDAFGQCSDGRGGHYYDRSHDNRNSNTYGGSNNAGGNSYNGNDKGGNNGNSGYNGNNGNGNTNAHVGSNSNTQGTGAQASVTQPADGDSGRGGRRYEIPPTG